MNREIKFRGFDNEFKCWRYGFYTKLIDGARIYHAIIVEDENAEDRLTRYYIHNSATVGQFTGLQDDTGQDVYAGDILKYSNMDDHHTEFSRNFVVEFGEQDLGHASYQQTIGWNATPIDRYGKPSLMDSGRLSAGILDIFGCHKIEVVGNIHQDCHLISND